MKHHPEHEREHERHRASGGETGGVNDARKESEEKTPRRNIAPKIFDEAEKRAHGGKAEHKKHEPVRHHEECKCKRCMGGRAARKRGGGVAHKEGFGPEHESTKMMALKHGGMARKKHVGNVEGEHAKHRADRKPRKAGGRTGADQHPFSSARAGTDVGHKVGMELE
jgi:hypothetical protein